MVASFFLPQKKLTVGLALTENTLTFICLKKLKVKNKYQLICYGYFNRRNVEAIKKAFSHPLIRSSTIRVSIDEPLVKTYPLLLPKVPPNEFKQVLKWGLKNITTDDINNFNLDAYPVEDESSDTKKNYIVFAVEKQLLLDLTNELHSFNVKKPERIEPQSIALTNALIKTGALINNSCSLFINFGINNTTLSVINKNGLLLTRPYFSASEAGINTLISQNLGIDKNLAGQYLFNTDSVPPEKMNIFQSSLNQFFAELSVELKRTFELFGAEFPNHKIESIFVTGQSSTLPGMLNYLKDRLQLPVEILNIFSCIDASHISAVEVEKLKLIMCTAMGLAL